MLKKLLNEKKCFKLICGAGNENLKEVERLVALYSKAGCHFFDLSAGQEVLNAAKRGLDFSIPKKDQKDYHFCISIGTKNDVHMQKAWIDKKKCQNCFKCLEVCPQNAILENNSLEVIEKFCIGCMKCQKVCNFGAITPVRQSHNTKFDFLSFSPLDCVELHASDTDEDEVDEIWDYLNENFDGFLSLCIGRKYLSDEQVYKRITRLVSKREPYTTIIQADGSPMTGGEDDFKTTLQAVSMAELVNKWDLPVYILMSGGTNSKTGELARLCGVDFNGIGVGSFARKIVKGYITRDDFFTNPEVFEPALKIASELVKSAGAKLCL